MLDDVIEDLAEQIHQLVPSVPVANCLTNLAVLFSAGHLQFNEHGDPFMMLQGVPVATAQEAARWAVLAGHVLEENTGDILGLYTPVAGSG